MTSRHPAVSCACPKCQSERRTTPPPTAATDEREAVARAIMIARDNGGCIVKDWEAEARDNPHVSQALNQADAALSTLAQVRAAEILAAEANERARWVDWLATGANVWRETTDNATGEPPKFFHAQGAEYAMLKVMDAMRRNEHGSGK